MGKVVGRNSLFIMSLREEDGAKKSRWWETDPWVTPIRVGLLAEKTLWAFNDIRWLFWRRGSVSPSLLGHDDLIFLFVCFFIVRGENSLSPPTNRSIENSVIHLSPFGLSGESKGQICEAPKAATLYWSLDRTSGAANTFEEGERETTQGENTPKQPSLKSKR